MKTNRKSILLTALTIISIVTSSCGVPMELHNQLSADHDKLKSDFNSFKQLYPEVKNENTYLKNKYAVKDSLIHLTDDNIDFEVVSAIGESGSKKLIVTVLITNNEEDKQFASNKKNCNVITDLGDQYALDYFYRENYVIGDYSLQDLNEFTTVYKGAPVKMKIIFSNVDSKAKKIKLLNLTFQTKTRDFGKLQFREIPIKWK